MKTISVLMAILGIGLLIASAYSGPGFVASILLIGYSTAVCIRLEPGRR